MVGMEAALEKTDSVITSCAGGGGSRCMALLALAMAYSQECLGSWHLGR